MTLDDIHNLKAFHLMQTGNEPTELHCPRMQMEELAAELQKYVFPRVHGPIKTIDTILGMRLVIHSDASSFWVS